MQELQAISGMFIAGDRPDNSQLTRFVIGFLSEMKDLGRIHVMADYRIDESLTLLHNQMKSIGVKMSRIDKTGEPVPANQNDMMKVMCLDTSLGAIGTWLSSIPRTTVSIVTANSDARTVLENIISNVKPGISAFPSSMGNRCMIKVIGHSSTIPRRVWDEKPVLWILNLTGSKPSGNSIYEWMIDCFSPQGADFRERKVLESAILVYWLGDSDKIKNLVLSGNVDFHSGRLFIKRKRSVLQDHLRMNLCWIGINIY